MSMKTTGSRTKEDVCKAAEMIVKLSQSQSRGGAPSFTPYHIIEFLKAASQGSIGRPSLQRTLGLGEASIKTLILRLRDADLITHKGKGHETTERGRNVINYISNLINYKHINFDIPGLWDEDSIVVNSPCIKPPKTLTEVYFIRDYLVSSGCRMSVIGGAHKGYLKFPGVPGYIANELRIMLSDYKLDGLVVVAPLTCVSSVVSGILKAVIDLCCNS